MLAIEPRLHGELAVARARCRRLADEDRVVYAPQALDDRGVRRDQSQDIQHLQLKTTAWQNYKMLARY